MPPAPLHRRTTLRAAGAGCAVGLSVWGTGCTVHGDPPDRAEPSRAPLAPATAHDVDLAARAAEDLALSVALVARVLEEHPQLAPRVRPLLRTQRTHLRLLRRAAENAGGSTATPRPVPRDRGRALALVVRTAQADRTMLNRAAVSARSGRFAQLLAGMGAALSQRLVVIDRAST